QRHDQSHHTTKTTHRPIPPRYDITACQRACRGACSREAEGLSTAARDKRYGPAKLHPTVTCLAWLSASHSALTAERSVSARRHYGPAKLHPTATWFAWRINQGVSQIAGYSPDRVPVFTHQRVNR